MVSHSWCKIRTKDGAPKVLLTLELKILKAQHRCWAFGLFLCCFKYSELGGTGLPVFRIYFVDGSDWYCWGCLSWLEIRGSLEALQEKAEDETRK